MAATKISRNLNVWDDFEKREKFTSCNDCNGKLVEKNILIICKFWKIARLWVYRIHGNTVVGSSADFESEDNIRQPN